MLTATSQFGTRVPENSCLRASFYSNRGARSFLESKMKTRTCIKCHSEHPATNEFFYKDSRRRDGLGSWCRACVCAASSRWAKAHPELKLKNNKRWRAAHPEVQARWNESHPEIMRECRARWEKANAKKAKECKARWRTAHPEAIKAHGITHRAVSAGRLVCPSSCACCGKEGNLYMHHPDYSQPLRVIMLCPKCHNQFHGKAKGRKSDHAKL
jgi:hypothetical protein